MPRARMAFIGMVAMLVLWPLAHSHLRAVAGDTLAAGDGDQRTPVLIELFTSEGCSSCPPADFLLERLDRSQPVRGAEVIVLSEHVDYWNDIGWKDPYSSHESSNRQSAYAGRFGLKGVYTPQMVVDGHIEFVGSDERSAIRAIENETKVEKTPVSLSSIHFQGANTMSLHVQAGPMPSSIAAGSADVLVAIADDSDESHVSRGENAGRTLKHVAVLRNLIRVGTVGKTAGFSQDLKVDLSNRDPRNVRIVAIAQEISTGRVWGAGYARLLN